MRDFASRLRDLVSSHIHENQLGFRRITVLVREHNLEIVITIGYDEGFCRLNETKEIRFGLYDFVKKFLSEKGMGDLITGVSYGPGYFSFWISETDAAYKKLCGAKND